MRPHSGSKVCCTLAAKNKIVSFTFHFQGFLACFALCPRANLVLLESTNSMGDSGPDTYCHHLHRHLGIAKQDY